MNSTQTCSEDKMVQWSCS